MRSAIRSRSSPLYQAELIAANSGIGQVIMDARFALQTSRIIVGLFVLGVLGALPRRIHIGDLHRARPLAQAR